MSSLSSWRSVTRLALELRFELLIGDVLVLPHHHHRLAVQGRVLHDVARGFLRAAVERPSTCSSSSAALSGTTEYSMIGFDQLAAAGEASSSVCRVMAKKKAGLLAFGEQRLGGVAAEIGQGERIGALLGRSRKASRHRPSRHGGG